MRTILKIIIVLCLAGVVWGFWNVIIKSGVQQSSKVEDLVSMGIASSNTAAGTAPQAESTEQEESPAQSPVQNSSHYNYQPEDTQNDIEDIDEIFIDGSAQHNYIDITGTATQQNNIKSNQKEDKRKYFLKEEQKKQLVAFDNEYKKRKMSKDELFTELMDAVYFDDMPKALALIHKGAPLNSPEKNTEFTPVFMAISNGSENMLRMLIEQGSSIDIYDDKGYAPIHRAVTAENYTSSAPYPANIMIEVLLEYGADINQGTKKEGLTPLMITAKEHKSSIMQFLIDSGANDEIKDKDERTALDYAKTYECTSCIRILLS